VKEREMKRRVLKTAGAVTIAVMASTGLVWAEQARPRNPGAASGGSSGGSGGGGGGGDTGRVATPRGGGSAPWGGSTTAARPSRPATSGTRRAPSTGPASEPGQPETGYARRRSGAVPTTGQAVPRGTVGTLPPVVSGPVYWGAGNNAWHFFPWGFGGLGLGYLWDPLFWGGYGGYGMGGYGLGGYGLGGYGLGGYGGAYGAPGYPVDPGLGWGGGGSAGSYGGYSSSSNPLQATDALGGLRLRVRPRSADVFVSGHFAGVVDDFDGPFQRLKLPQGPHTVEIKANGYEPLALDVLILEGETTTWQGELTPRN
jgi:hypothetical protein